MKIVKLTNRNKSFYPTMGPFLANRHIEKDIGYKLYDDAGKIWFVAKKGQKVIGFATFGKKQKSNHEHRQLLRCEKR